MVYVTREPCDTGLPHVMIHDVIWGLGYRSPPCYRMLFDNPGIQISPFYMLLDNHDDWDTSLPMIQGVIWKRWDTVLPYSMIQDVIWEPWDTGLPWNRVLFECCLIQVSNMIEDFTWEPWALAYRSFHDSGCYLRALGSGIEVSPWYRMSVESPELWHTALSMIQDVTWEPWALAYRSLHDTGCYLRTMSSGIQVSLWYRMLLESPEHWDTDLSHDTCHLRALGYSSTQVKGCYLRALGYRSPPFYMLLESPGIQVRVQPWSDQRNVATMPHNNTDFEWLLGQYIPL